MEPRKPRKKDELTMQTAKGRTIKLCLRCEEWLDLEKDFKVSKEGARGPIWNTYCKECVKRYDQAVKEHRRGGNPTRWSYFLDHLKGEWKPVPDGVVRFIRSKTEHLAFMMGVGHLAEDIVQFALIQAYQGKIVNPRFSVLKFLDIEMGTVGSPERFSQNNMVYIEETLRKGN